MPKIKTIIFLIITYLCIETAEARKVEAYSFDYLPHTAIQYQGLGSFANSSVATNQLFTSGRIEYNFAKSGLAKRVTLRFPFQAKVIDKASAMILEDAQIKLFVGNPRQTVTYEINQGVLFLEAEPGSDYMLIVSKSGYRDVFLNLSGDKLIKDETHSMTIELTSNGSYSSYQEELAHTDKYLILDGKISDLNIAERLQGVEVKLFVDGTVEDVQLTGENGEVNFKTLPDRTYMLMATRGNYQDIIYHLPPNSVEAMQHEFDLLMVPKEIVLATSSNPMKGITEKEWDQQDRWIANRLNLVDEPSGELQPKEDLSFLEPVASQPLTATPSYDVSLPYSIEEKDDYTNIARVEATNFKGTNTHDGEMSNIETVEELHIAPDDHELVFTQGELDYNSQEELWQQEIGQKKQSAIEQDEILSESLSPFTDNQPATKMDGGGIDPVAYQALQVEAPVGLNKDLLMSHIDYRPNEVPMSSTVSILTDVIDRTTQEILEDTQITLYADGTEQPTEYKDGILTFEAVASNKYSLRLSKPGYRDQLFNIPPEATDVSATEQMVFSLERAQYSEASGEIAGKHTNLSDEEKSIRVVDSEGEPLPVVTAGLFIDGEKEKSLYPDLEGKFVLPVISSPKQELIIDQFGQPQRIIPIDPPTWPVETFDVEVPQIEQFDTSTNYLVIEEAPLWEEAEMVVLENIGGVNQKYLSTSEKLYQVVEEENNTYLIHGEEKILVTKEDEFNFGLGNNHISNAKEENSDEIISKTESSNLEGKALQINNIYYDFDKSSIRDDAAAELDKLANLLKQHGDLKLAMSSHTDVRGSDSYNVALSKRRAKAAVDYLLAKGVSADRFVTNGFGESKTINNCIDGKSCSEIEHQLNRRTEFRILQ